MKDEIIDNFFKAVGPMPDGYIIKHDPATNNYLVTNPHFGYWFSYDYHHDYKEAFQRLVTRTEEFLREH